MYRDMNPATTWKTKPEILQRATCGSSIRNSHCFYCGSLFLNQLSLNWLTEMPTGILEMDRGHKSFTATVGATKTKTPSARSFIRPDIAAASLKVIAHAKA
jgi:hypothetical protein